MINGLDRNLAALQALDRKLKIAANNVANVNIRGYKKQQARAESTHLSGIAPNLSNPTVPSGQAAHQAGDAPTEHPPSDVNLGDEMTHMALGQQAYKANLKTMQARDEILGSLLDIKA
jgi:flagellar basal-body rod protein FlgC